MKLLNVIAVLGNEWTCSVDLSCQSIDLYFG
jgi:hypothetical protein